MNEKIEQILNEIRMPASTIEKELGFSNGLLGKAKKGITQLSEEKFNALVEFRKKRVITEINEPTTPKNENKITKKRTDAPKGLPQNNEILEAKKKDMSPLIDKINKDFGAGTVVCLTDTPKEKLPSISTGSHTLNAALGIGGLPRGRIVEMVGPESSGKTTLALNVVKEAQKCGLMCALIDCEHAFDIEYATKLGVDMDYLYVSQPDYGERALEITDMLILGGNVNVVVFDSVAAIVPKAELQGEMGDSKMGLIARLMSQALRKLTPSVSKTNCLLIFINQYRSAINANPYQPQEIPTGGNALKYYASVRLDVRKSTQIKDGDTIIGNKVRVKVVKNKCAPPFKVAEYDFYYDKGIDNIGEIIEMALTNGIIKQTASWFSYEDSKIGQGKNAVTQMLADNPELLDNIKRKLSL